MKRINQSIDAFKYRYTLLTGVYGKTKKSELSDADKDELISFEREELVLDLIKFVEHTCVFKNKAGQKLILENISRIQDAICDMEDYERLVALENGLLYMSLAVEDRDCLEVLNEVFNLLAIATWDPDNIGLPL